jgi:hypothetical protein
MRKIIIFLQFFGFDPIRFFKNIIGIKFYIVDYFKYKKQADSKFPICFYPILNERADQSGSISGHYFHQDLLVSQLIFKNNPISHVDVGSRVDGFIAHVASFRKIVVLDIRENTVRIENIKFKQADMMNLEHELYNSCDSLSSLHVLEHFGLGRYGDPIDINGYINGFNNMSLMLKSGGKFYLSVPIGGQRVEFNAHRIFGIKTILDLCEKEFILDSFSYVDDIGDLHKNVQLQDNDIENSFNCRYGCGIFELTKKKISNYNQRICN